jgi:hypothetical protein
MKLAGRMLLPILLGALASIDAGARESSRGGRGARDEATAAAEAHRASDRAGRLSRRDDERRPDDQWTVNLFGRPLTIGGEYETRWVYESDTSLGRKDDDGARLGQKFELELLYRIQEEVSIFLEGRTFHRSELYDEAGHTESNGEFVRGETWVLIDHVRGSNFGLQLGRQNFRDKREWWWDADLDALRLHYDRAPFRFQFGLAEELARTSTDQDRIDPEQEDVLRLIGQARWQWAEKHRVEAFWLTQIDHSDAPRMGEVLAEDREDETDADLTWLGLRAMGRWKPRSAHRVYYWLDAAVVAGQETVFDFDGVGKGRSALDDRSRRDVQGWALDVGATWAPRWAGRPRFTLGYAIGSGDRHPDGGTDRAFRQTGLQDNNGRYRGVDRFRYYGELLRPELSNLHIGTFSLGFPLLRNSSIELVYHLYRQVHPAPFLRDSDIDARPLGSSRDIGQEIDLVLGIEEWKHVEFELVGSLFRAGSAYGARAGRLASGVTLKIDYSF